jgi:hypothetical protein
MITAALPVSAMRSGRQGKSGSCGIDLKEEEK